MYFIIQFFWFTCSTHILNSNSTDQSQISGFERWYRIMLVMMMVVMMVMMVVMVMVYSYMKVFALKRLEAAGDDRSGRFGLVNIRPWLNTRQIHQIHDELRGTPLHNLLSNKSFETNVKFNSWEVEESSRLSSIFLVILVSPILWSAFQSS